VEPRVRRPLVVTILMVLTAVGGVLGSLVGLGLVAGLIDPATVGAQGPDGAAIPASVAGVGVLAYALLGWSFAYGAWMHRRWGWTAGLVLWVVSGLSDALAALLGYLPPANAVVQVLIAVALIIYWFRPSVKAAFGRS